MTMRRFGHPGIFCLSRWAYSMACAVEWMEQGPTTTMRRSSLPALMRAAAKRAEAIVWRDSGEDTISCLSSAGCTRGSYCVTGRDETSAATGDGREKTHADNATVLDVHLHLELVLGDGRRICAVRPDRHHFVGQGCVGRAG